MSRNSNRFAAPSQNLVARKANTTDLDFICGCILYGARKGHYAFDAKNPLLVRCMKNEIHSIISRELLLDQRGGTASVYSLDNTRIGTLIVSEAAPGSGCLELYALSVAQKYQKNGYGSLIIDDLINHYPNTDIYARCSPTSERMYRLLSDRFFHFVELDGDHRVLKRDGIPAAALTM